MSFNEVLDLTADVFYFVITAIEKPYTTAVYLRTNNEFSLSLQQYLVGDSHNINGMRAAGGSGDTLGLQEKDPKRGVWYLVNNVKQIFHVATRNTSSPTRRHTL